MQGDSLKKLEVENLKIEKISHVEKIENVMDGQKSSDDNTKENSSTNDINGKEDTNGEREILYDGDVCTVWKEKMCDGIFLDININKLEIDERTKAFRNKMSMTDDKISVLLPDEVSGLFSTLGDDYR